MTFFVSPDEKGLKEEHLANVGKVKQKTAETARAGVAQWIECHPANQGVAGLIPIQGTCLGYGPGPRLGACERQPIDVSFTL